MPRRSPTYYTESQRALMWERWQRGESLQTIAQLFDRNHSSVQRILRTTGEIRPPERGRATGQTQVQHDSAARLRSGYGWEQCGHLRCHRDRCSRQLGVAPGERQHRTHRRRLHPFAVA